MNYTISITEGNIDDSLVESSWTDPTTNITYDKAFGLVNPCNFPNSIKEGDEFYFYLDTVKQQNCAICLAYYPTPAKKLNIRIAE